MNNRSDISGIECLIEVEFGDCDPAGIVFYPRFFTWFDATFQKWLRAYDVSQRSLQQERNILGTGLMDTGARFVSPVRPGDKLTLTGNLGKVTNKSLCMNYTGYVNNQLALEGFEVRGLFIEKNHRIQAAPLSALWEAMGIYPPP